MPSAVFPFKSANDTVSAKSAVLITPSDTLTFPLTRGLWVGVGGNINCVFSDGNVVLLSNVPAGVLPVQVIGVYNTSTTATTMVALY